MKNNHHSRARLSAGAALMLALGAISALAALLGFLGATVGALMLRTMPQSIIDSHPMLKQLAVLFFGS